jgi:hypothetical protein
MPMYGGISQDIHAIKICDLPVVELTLVYLN